VIDQIGSEVLELLFGELDFLEPGDDFVEGEKAFFLPRLDELLQLLDIGLRNVDREHLSQTSGVPLFDDADDLHKAGSATPSRLHLGPDSTSGFTNSEP